MEWKISVNEGMEANTIQENFCNHVVRRISQAFHQYKRYVLYVSKWVWQVGADDPRRVIHSMKVGLALSLVLILYFVRSLFDSFGANAMWAVMTVVVVFEFTVGAILSKGLNRSLATLLVGLLGVWVSYVVELTRKNCERVILGVFVFALGTACTYSRFFPVTKQRYDYGVVIFLLTFNLVAISSSRVENILKLAYRRIATIIIRCTLCFIINVFAFPFRAGDDLHNLIIHNLEGLTGTLQECVTKYFVESKDAQDSNDDKVGSWYKCVLNSKATEDSLANFARWKPLHGRFFFKYPCQLYLKVGSVTTYNAYCVEAINRLLNVEIQREYLKAPCIEIGRETANIPSELSESIKTMGSINPTLMMDQLKAMVEELQNSMRA